MVKVAICDDDPNFLRRYRDFLSDLFQRQKIAVQIDIFNNGRDLVAWVEKKDNRYDLVFLDINMPEIDGFSVAGNLRKLDKDFRLVFTTLMQAVPRQAFKYNVFRYIVKDAMEMDTEEAIDAYIRISNLLLPEDEFVTFRYTYKGGKDHITVRKRDIIYLEMVNRRVRMYTVKGEYDLQTYPIAKYMETLGEESFMIASRKYCVNFAQVISLKGDFFLMSNNHTICIGTSRKAKSEAKLRYGNYRSIRS